MRKWILFIMAVSVWSPSLRAGSRTDTGWKDIRVDVKGDHVDQLDVVKKITTDKSGFTRLDIKITNPGVETARLDFIVVRVPLMEQIPADADILFGGTCMGRTPLRRVKANDPALAPDAKNPARSAMFEMIRLADNHYIFAGSVSWRVFLPYFYYHDNAFEIRSDAERKPLKPGDQVRYEQILFTRGNCWQDILDRFGEAIAKENKVRHVKDAQFMGWSTWDYYGRLFTDEDVIGNMNELNQFAPEANLIQIDGGWWVERGDYTRVRDDITGGIKALADRIRAEGKIPGLHFDGFRADAASEICRNHPEFFLHDQNGNLIIDYKQKVDRLMKYIFFDYSHPGARAHSANCIRVMKEEWGIRYFKVDFMRYGLKEDILKNVNKKEQIVKFIRAYDPSLTSVERFRLGMQTIRDAIGKDNYFLGCSAVFGPCIGFVDGMRTGGDVSPRYEAFPERCLANAGNWYLNGKVFNGDADYLVFRAAEDEDERVVKSNKKFGGHMTLYEAKTWADFNIMYGNCRLASDNLMTLRPERKKLVRYVFDYPAAKKTVPLDVWKHATNKQDGFEVLLSQSGKDILLGIFNWGNEKKTTILRGFDEKALFITCDGKKLPVQAGSIAITLEGHHSTILKYVGEHSFDELRKLIQFN